MIVIFCLLLAFTNVGFAKKLYKYQDDRGIWHYTDKKPSGIHKFETRQLKVKQAKRRVWLEKSGNSEQPEFSIRNTYYGPIEVEIDFIEQNNAKSTPPLPNRFVVDNGQSGRLFLVRGINPRQSWQFTLQYQYTLGQPLANYRSNYAYRPPLAPGSEFLISQGFGGKFSHTDEQNHYAVDIAMPEHSPVHASRGGVVMEVEDDYFNSGTEQMYKSRANSIRILHEDGSMAIYAHLALERAQVFPGLRVAAGELIGYSGNTGFSSGPHLHFAVQINNGMNLVSVPFEFYDADGHSFVPETGQRLEGFAAASKKTANAANRPRG